MNLDLRVCSRARLARDARFDGKFFIGVLTTKIYCRPICRSRTSKESNVRYFPAPLPRRKLVFARACVAARNAPLELPLGPARKIRFREPCG
jgi:methylphosphotriester-DNA--protein-cysteine methyltransferase